MNHPKPLELTGQRLGRWTFIRITEERAPDKSFVWVIRCRCDAERLLSTTDYRNCRSKGCEPKCSNCGTRSSSRRCGKITNASTCELCAGLSHRVSGPQCRVCGMPYADEPREEFDYCARLPGNLARAVTA